MQAKPKKKYVRPALRAIEPEEAQRELERRRLPNDPEAERLMKLISQRIEESKSNAPKRRLELRRAIPGRDA
jgi:hypothetical protein